MKTRNRKFAKVRTWMWILLISLGIRAESLDSLRQRQKTDQANLLEYYDNKALSDCPKLENGTINKASPEYKKISAEYQRAQEKLTIAYEKKYIRIQQSTGIDEENPSSAKEALISSTSAGIKDKGSRMEAEAQAEAEAKAEADARAKAKAKADAEAKAKAEKAMADAKAEAADAKAKAEATEARAKSEAAKAKAKAEMEAKAKSAAAEAKAKAQAAETQAKSDAKKAQAKAEAEQRAKSDAANAKAEAEAASAKAKTEAADAAAKAEIQQKAKAEAQTAKARAEASKMQAKAEAEIKAKAEAAAAKAKAEAKALASSKADAEIKAKAEAAAAKADAKAAKAKANADAAEVKAQADTAEAKAKADAEAKAKTAAAEAKANADAAAAKAKTDADVAKAKADAEVKAKADRASAKAQADAAEAKAKAEMEAKANADAVEAQAKADAAEARAKANASEVKAKADAANAKAKVDAEVKAKSNLVEVKAKADTPEIKVDTPNAGKSAAGKILKTGGDILQGVDTFGAAEDAKQEFKKGNFGEGAIKIGESIADEATYGAYSGGKTIKEKHDDVKGSESDIERTNRNLRDQHDQNLRVELRKAGMSQDDVNKIRTTDGLEHALRKQGLEVPEAPTEISYVDKGEKGVEQLEQQLSEIHKNKMRDDLVKSGKMTQEEADKLKTEAGLEHAMKKNNLDLPEKPESGFIEVDDSWDERVEQVGEGVKNNVKKAGKFVKETGSDLAEIGTGLTEEGVADQVIENSKENVEGWLKKWEEERKSEAYTGDNKEGLEEYLIKRGASPVGAKNAADDFYEKGDTGKLENLDDTLRYKEAVAEAKKRGEEIPSKEEFDQVSNSLKARKERAAQEKEEQAKREAQADAEQKKQTAEGEDQKKLQQEEAEDAEPWSEEKDLANKRAALAEFTQRNLEKRRQETEGDFEGMEVTKEMDEASHAGDDDRRQAKTERNQAGEDARDIESESNRVVKEGDAENSWGKHIGDAIEVGLTTGFKTAGQEFGNAAADQVIDEIWEPEKPTPPQGPPAGGSSPAASGSGGNSAGGMISAESGSDAIPADAPLPEGGQIAANPDAMENEPGIVDEDGLENEPGFTEGDASGSGEDDDDGWLEGVVVSGANKAAENLGKQIDDAVEKTSTPTSSAAEKESSSSPGDYPAGMKPCIRCGAVKKIPKQESLCLSCVTKVMASYSNYVQSGNGRGDEGYFQYLSSGTKAQIQRNNNR